MNRRNLLKTFIGRKKNAFTQVTAPQALTTSSLESYTGDWTFQKARHLLVRGMIGPNYAQMKEAFAEGKDATVERLLNDQPTPEHPVYYEPENPNGPVGTTWYRAINYDYAGSWWKRSLYGWQIGQFLNEGVSIRERMTLFWMNHFGVSLAVVGDKRVMYHYNAFIRLNALGNFKKLIQDITIRPAMLYFLNGRSNVVDGPNENYARELLELFLLGKGDLVSEGDYTTYTDDDVKELARVLTGWTVDFENSPDDLLTGGPVFIPENHDKGVKQLSHRFENSILTDNGSQEYKDLINLLFERKAETIAKFICRKIYQWFVHYSIDENIELNVIEPMAAILIEHDFEVKPVLEALLKSEVFYDDCSIGSIIKNPVDFSISILKQFQVEIPIDLYWKYRAWKSIYTSYIEHQQLDYFKPPSVAGWKAYYQQPQFYRTWINSVTMRERDAFRTRMINGRLVGDVFLKIDVLAFLQSLDNPDNPNAVVDECIKVLLPQGISMNRQKNLKKILLSGQADDAYWTELYSAYIYAPVGYEFTIETRMRQLIERITQMAEFQLM